MLDDKNIRVVFYLSVVQRSARKYFAYHSG